MGRLNLHAELPADADLATVRADRTRAVTIERDRRLRQLVITVAGIGYDADPDSRSNLQGLLAAHAAGVPIPWPLAWRCADNVTRDIDPATAAAVAGAMLAGVQRLYTSSWYLKDTLVTGGDLASLRAFDVTSDVWWNP